MSTAARPTARGSLLNLPNQLSAGRLVLSIVLFVLTAYGKYTWALGVFIVAASTDWLDGYFARKYNQVTQLGRILDPFVDKIIICGTFIFLVGIPPVESPLCKFILRPWMAAVIVGRELLVTALRSYLEGEGADFSASFSGKLKMVMQCIAAGAALFYLSYGATGVPRWVEVVTAGSVWSAVAITIWSGAAYVQRAVQIMRKKES
jgi:CDP-diacylglycerol--glycerol-3-phosphate 3-phosphatidyltransferase